MITLQVEPWPQYVRDALPLWQEHYSEIAVDKSHMAMGPDVEWYATMDTAGRLQIITARDDGRLVGYFISLIRRHTHYPVLCGFEDSYFLTLSHRRGWLGIKLIRENESQLKKRGVEKIFVMTKSFKSLASIFERLEYEHTDSVYAKWIGA